ncbi:MAG: dTMP kinase, partial [Azoarcus sp.]|nr:dTMP kinase [Azoarcus sp.]
LEAARCDALEDWVHPHLKPDLTLLFDLSPALAAARMAANGAEPDRFERERNGFFERVRAAYLDRAQREPGRFHVIDAARKPPEIALEIASVFGEKAWL